MNLTSHHLQLFHRCHWTFLLKTKQKHTQVYKDLQISWQTIPEGAKQTNKQTNKRHLNGPLQPPPSCFCLYPCTWPIGDFRVSFRLCFKASPRAKPFMQILVHLHVNKTNFHMKGFALGLALKQRRKATLKSPILLLEILSTKKYLTTKRNSSADFRMVFWYEKAIDGLGGTRITNITLNIRTLDRR